MVRRLSSSSKSRGAEQEVPHEQRRPRPERSTDSSGTSRMSSKSTFSSVVNTSSVLSSQSLRFRVSPAPSATSWTSNTPTAPPIQSTTPAPRNENAFTQFGAVGGGMAYTDQGTDPQLLHIGAQFYEVVDGGTHVVMSQTRYDTGHAYQNQPRWPGSNMAPMDRYEKQTIRDEPYGYMSVAEESSVAGWDGTVSTVDRS